MPRPRATVRPRSDPVDVPGVCVMCLPPYRVPGSSLCGRPMTLEPARARTRQGGGWVPARSPARRTWPGGLADTGFLAGTAGYRDDGAS